MFLDECGTRIARYSAPGDSLRVRYPMITQMVTSPPV